jgi:hypothetical protein
MQTPVSVVETPTVHRDGKAIAIMQPYFFPYAGYFRLFAAVDEFVIFDCVQFPRRGRVHRAQYQGASGAIAWLTLPLARQPRDTMIMDLSFAKGARDEFDRRLRRLPIPARRVSSAAPRLLEYLHQPLIEVVDYLEEGLRLVCEMLGLPCRIVRSSSLGLDPSLRGQDRVLAVAVARRATTYVNSPGGRHLYEHDAFLSQGIELRFLDPYEGPHRELLTSLMSLEPEIIAADVRTTDRIA